MTKKSTLRLPKEKHGTPKKPSGAQKKVDAHANDQEKHVSAADRKSWDAKETPSGAQDKVNKHANNEDIHVNKPFKDTLEELSKLFTADFKEKLEELLQQFTAHSYNQIRHISAAERKTWNGAATYANIMLKNGAAAGHERLYTQNGILSY